MPKQKIQALIEQRPGARQAISWKKIQGEQGQALYQSDLPLSSTPQFVVAASDAFDPRHIEVRCSTKND